ncbi:MAG: hypothetical protein AAGK00_11180 [Pseudomonadota bacterium]
MARLGNAILWPGETLCQLCGLREESDSKFLLRMFFNLVIWSKLMVAGAYLAIVLG